MAARVAIDTERIADFCQRNDIAELALFGSVLRDDFRSDSDVDVLVDFLPEAKVSLFRLVDLQDALTELFGRQVDLVTKPSLSKYIRDSVLSDREVLYVQT